MNNQEKTIADTIQKLKGKSRTLLIEVCNKLLDNTLTIKTKEERELMKKIVQEISDNEILSLIEIYLKEAKNISEIVNTK